MVIAFKCNWRRNERALRPSHASAQVVLGFLVVAVLASSGIAAKEKPNPSCETTVTQRIADALKLVQSTPSAFELKNIDRAAAIALSLLFKNENVSEALLRIYLLQRTKKLLNADARKAIGDHA